ncbi:hypothetical protein BS78_09G047900 [Paspalum vaginatum]|nr:hypothetical protein BS78_09G047900 [Paspalum vaginatum]
MMEVLRAILRDVSGQEYAGDIQHLIEKISNFLEHERYFIVVDDLWDSESWETIKCSFIKNSCGSRIITTTRKNDVAESCSSSHQNHIYKLRPLNDEDSRGLFLKRIFGTRGGCPSHLAEVSNDILKKCGGLPLAIISIAGLLAGKEPTFNEWNKVQSSFGYALERQSDVSRMTQVLSLSYFDLPPHLRSCLLYLSIFPEDYEIEKDRLVLRWIAEGFIHEEHGFTQYELGERCFNELINRSLIQPVYLDAWGTVTDCRVHDIILEFIVSKAMEENFVTLFGVPNTICDPHRMIRRISLQDRNEIGDAVVDLREKMIYSHTRGVSVFTDCFDSLPSLDKFRRVRVLDLNGCAGLQTKHLAHLGGLFTLRYLNLRRTRIHMLPEEIGELQYLQTLDVRIDELKELPSSVVHLARLANLLCDHSVQLPDGFGSMQALQRLEAIGLSYQPPGFTHELCQLRNLRSLEVYVSEFSRGVVSSPSTLGAERLSSLIIWIKQEFMNLMMEPWSPTPLSLKLLEIRWCSLAKVPTWIGLLDNLRQLDLCVEHLRPADIDMLGHLNALSYLYLSVFIEVSDRSSSSKEAKQVKITNAQGFPSLRKFLVGSRDCGLGLFFEAGAMPKLQELELRFDTDKTVSLTNGEFDFGIQHLPFLAIVTCRLGYWRGGKAKHHPAWNALKVAVSSNPNHPSLVTNKR